MITKYSSLHEAFTEDLYYSEAIERKDTKLLESLVAKKAREKGYLLGPVYHGTVYSWKGNHFQGYMQFFSDKESFAYNYAQQKSFEGQMDADISVRSFYLLGRVFDPSKSEHIKKILPLLPDTIQTTSSWGFGRDFSKEKWVQRLLGEEIFPPKFSEEDLSGKKPGDLLPDNTVMRKPLEYQFLGFQQNDVLYTRAYSVESLMSGGYLPFGAKERNPPNFTRQEVIEDLKKLLNPEYQAVFDKKYRLFLSDQRTSYSCYKTSRYPQKITGVDTWTLFEGDPKVIDAILSAGFRIIKMREKNETTYATLSPNQIKLAEPITYDNAGEIIPLSERFNPSTKDFRY